MVLASVALAVLVGAAFGVLIVVISNVHRQQRATAHSEQVIETANQFEQLVLDLETDARRYAITGKGVYLGPLVSANANLKTASNRLIKLSQSDPLTLVSAQRLQDEAQHYVSTFASLVIETAVHNPSAAKALVIGPSGLTEEAKLRKQFAAFVEREQSRTDAARARSGRLESYTVILGGIGLGMSLLLIGLYWVFVSRRVVEPVRRVADATHRFAAGNLSERVDPGGDDEIGELKRNFNTMAESIARQQSALETQNEDLERLATELRSVLDSTVDGIALTDLEGNVQIANRPMRRFAVELGMRGGRNVLDQLLSITDKVTDPERYVETMERLRGFPEVPSADEFELSDSRSFIGYTSPLTSRDEVIGRIWTLRDVTQERELDRLKDEFVATVSHELRTPLTSMMGFIEMLREGEAGELSEQQERFLAIVARSSERLQRLVGDLLFVARLDAGGLKLELADGVPLEEVVAEAVESASAEARSHEVELRLEPNGSVPVRGDRERLGQLVSNLLSNAVKFTPAGGNVTARVFKEAGHGVIEVEDTGIGIPKAEQERLFQRFFRASTATDQAIPGTGLGLAITKAITEAHEGTITVRSDTGLGTTFRIELPL